MSKNSQSGAFCIVVSGDGGKVLLTKRKDVPVWVLPGGGVEVNEGPEEAARREVLEETGMTVQISRLCGHYFPVNRLAYETFVYEGRPISGKLTLTDETSDIGYFSLNELPSSLFFLHREWIIDWQHSDGILITKNLAQVNYWQLFKHALLHPVITLKFLMTRLRLMMGKGSS